MHPVRGWVALWLSEKKVVLSLSRLESVLGSSDVLFGIKSEVRIFWVSFDGKGSPLWLLFFEKKIRPFLTCLSS